MTFPPAAPITRILSYARVSIADRTHADFTTLDSQEDLIARHCAHQSEITGRPWKIIACYRDEQSGKDLHRPGLNAAMEHIKTKGADAIVVYKLDRISRSLFDFLRLDAELQAQNVAIVSVKEQLDTSTPFGRAMRSLLLVFAQLERETILLRTKDAYDTRVRSGLWAGGGPRYAFRRVEKGVLELIPEEAEIARRVFQLFGIDGWSTQEIARAFNNEGVPTRNGGQWSSKIVRDILRTDAFYGEQRHGDRVGPWPFELVIDPVVAAQAASRLSQIVRTRGPNRVRHPWQGLIRCGQCGATVGLHSSHGGPRDREKRYHYLECTQYVRAKELAIAKCPMPSAPLRWQADWTEQVLAACRVAQPPPEPEPRPDRERELLAIGQERRRWNIAFTAPGSQMSEDEYLAGLADLDGREQVLRPEAQPDLAMATTLAHVWTALDIGEQNSALRALVHRATLYADHVEIQLKRTGWTNWPVNPIRVPRSY